MGRYVTVKNTPSNLLWMAQWDALSLANLQNSDNVNARLTIKNRPKSGGGFENILEFEKFTTLIENISTANPLTDTVRYTEMAADTSIENSPCTHKKNMGSDTGPPKEHAKNGVFEKMTSSHPSTLFNPLFSQYTS